MKFLKTVFAVLSFTFLINQFALAANQKSTFLRTFICQNAEKTFEAYVLFDHPKWVSVVQKAAGEGNHQKWIPFDTGFVVIAKSTMQREDAMSATDDIKVLVSYDQQKGLLVDLKSGLEGRPFLDVRGITGPFGMGELKGENYFPQKEAVVCTGTQWI